MSQPIRFALLVALLGLVAGCGGKEAGESRRERDRPLVLTTFYPVTYFTERMAGDLVELRCPLPDDADPIFWRPGDGELEAFMGADLIIRNGAGFERWMRSASLPESRVVDSAAPLAKDLITIKSDITHSHGGKGAHSHAGIDGHTWVDPVNAASQVEVIRDALIRLLPGDRNGIETRALALLADLKQLRVELEEICAEAQRTRQPLVASHPAYNYLARRFGLALESFDLDPESKPDDETVAHLKKVLAGHPARAILWESEPLPEVAALLRAECGLESFVFSPCEMLSAEDQAKGMNFLTVMQSNLGNLRSALALR